MKKIKTFINDIYALKNNTNKEKNFIKFTCF